MTYLKNITTLQVFPDKCTGCGRCMEVCPHAVFKLEDKKVTITDKDRCMECGACEKNCDFGAISVKAGVGCATAVINGMIRGTEPDCGCDGTSGACC
ncbi:MAG TPA: mercury methylation ferredoxin HgcB [Spirochaetota bacterium]|nr:mercury methylation ferredoxin HgcB [Spirochaetota bacterium]HPS86851.1 mercury methylation ferredoxin HgcB [Spirochaetota bacterium]